MTEVQLIVGEKTKLYWLKTSANVKKGSTDSEELQFYTLCTEATTHTPSRQHIQDSKRGELILCHGVSNFQMKSI